MTNALPRTLDGALDTQWLTSILSDHSGGKTVASADVVELIQVNATKVRFTANYSDGSSGSFCLKAFLDQPTSGGGGSASNRECGFYNKLAGKLDIRTPDCVTAPVDDDGFGILIMRDLIVEQDAHFHSALEPFDPDLTSKGLELLAQLHNCHTIVGPIEQIDWVPRMIGWLSSFMSAETIQGLMDGPRSDGMSPETCNAENLLTALKTLSAFDETRPVSLIHGDCHAGNTYMTGAGMGLIDFQVLQQGGWSLDVAYHIAATLPVDVAEREERALLNHYLEVARGLGGELPDNEEAWRQYRLSPVYGFLMWSITKNVQADITNTFFNRLGSAVTRHDSYALLARQAAEA